MTLSASANTLRAVGSCLSLHPSPYKHRPRKKWRQSIEYSQYFQALEPHSCDALYPELPKRITTTGTKGLLKSSSPCTPLVRSYSSDPSCRVFTRGRNKRLGFLRCRAPSTPHPPTRSPPVSAVTKARRSVLHPIWAG